MSNIVHGADVGATFEKRTFPLSSTQQMIWLDQTLNANSSDYNISSVMRINSAFDTERFLRAFTKVTQRHDAMRLKIERTDTSAAQYAVEGLMIPLQHYDFSMYTDNAERTRDVINSYLNEEFDLNGAIWRSALIKTDSSHGYWVLTSHHLASDGVSFSLLINDVIDAYRNDAQGLSVGDKKAPSYFDFVEEDRAYFDSKHYVRDLDFWTKRYQDLPPVLLSQKPSSSDTPPPSPSLTWTLNEDLFHSIETLVSQAGLSLQHFIYAVIACYFARITGEEDIVIGMPVHNRRGMRQKRTVGMFASVIPVGITLAPDDSFMDVMRKASSELRRCYRHQRLPIAELNRHTKVQQKTGRPQLFDVMALFSSHNFDLSLKNENGVFECIEDHQGALLPLSVVFSQFTVKNNSGKSQYTTLRLSPNARYMDEKDIQTLKKRLAILIDALVATPDVPVWQLPIMPQEERRYLLETLNDTQRKCPTPAQLHREFEAQVERTPEAIAIRYDKRTISYDMLNKHANQLAHRLIAQGVQAHDRIALHFERSPEMIIAMLAVLKAGGAYLPLDPTYPIARLHYMINDAEPKAIITSAAHIKTLDSDIPRISFDLSDEATLEPHRNHNPDIPGLAADALAYVMYTSGSTGQPKGVMIEHRNVNHLVKNNGYTHISANDCMAHCANTAFDTATWEVWSALLNGAQLFIIPQSVLLAPMRFQEALLDGGVTSMVMSTGLFHEYLDVLKPVMPQLRYMLIGGDVLDPQKIAQLQQAHALPKHLLNGYGPTETTAMATAHDVSAHKDATQPFSIGRAIGNTRLYVLDPYQQPVPLGVTGELYIAGPGVARGYLNQPEMTAERFVDDPFVDVPNERMYKTGDLARWNTEGTLDYLGRNDDQVKLRGFRIELGEIENRLVQHPDVGEAVVIVREDTANTKQLVAYLITEPGRTVTPADLRQHVSQQLADYMVPSAFVTMAKFPLTPNGKLDRKALPAPDDNAIAVREYEAPVGEAETLLATLWEELLGVERVGRRDHFFELGGHSLRLVSLIERVRQFGWRLDMHAVFSAPVLADQALMLKAIGSLPTQPEVPPNRIPCGCTYITPDLLPLVKLSQKEIDLIASSLPGGAAQIQDIYPLAPLQEGILFHHRIQSDGGDTYLIRCLMGFDTCDQRTQFLEAIQHVIDRHDILRTALQWENVSQPVQVVWRQANIPIDTFTPDAKCGDVEAQLLAHTDPDHCCMDLQKAPLFSAVTAHNTDNGEWLLSLSFHHLICDHVSLELILEEVALLIQGNADALQAPQPYRNFIAYLAQTDEEKDKRYFQERLRGLNTPTLPFGIPDMQGSDGEAINEAFVTLDETLSQNVRGQASRLGVSASVLFHTACARMLAHISGQDDVVLGTVLMGRMQGSAGIDRMMGLFLNTLPLRVSMANTSLLHTLQDTHKHLIELLEHEQAPLAQVQRASDIASSEPLFNTLLNYRHTEADLNTWPGMRVIRAQDRTSYPITLSIDNLEDGFRIQSQTVSSLNAQRMADHLVAALTHVIDALIHDEQRETLTLPMLLAPERQRILEEFNDTHRRSTSSTTLQNLFEQQVRQTPHAEALVFGETSLSYSALSARANQVAHYLIAQGIRPGDRVGICMERGFDMVIAFMAACKAGATYVPLDPHYPAERLSFMFDDASPAILLTDDASSALFDTGTAQTVKLDTPPLALASMPDTPPAVEAAPDQGGYLIYTSGSTGQPKGVEMPQRALVNLLDWHRQQPELHGSGKTLQFAAIGFDVAFQEIFTTLCEGGCLVLIDEELRRNPAQLLTLIQQQHVNRLFLPYVALQQLADSAASIDGDFTSLKAIVSAGEQLHITPSIRALLDRTAPCTLHNHYGPTETHVCIAQTFMPPMASWPALPSIGSPINNTHVYVLDAYQNPVPIGIVGELYIAGDCLANGYFNRTDLTEERFIANPFSQKIGARMYKTGDLVRWNEDGTLDYIGRNDDQVKLRGFRIELGEVESRLTQCEGIREAAVMVREDVPGDKRLVAYIRTTGDEPSLVTLREQLSLHLADYMVPSAFVTLETLPFSPNGKLDRKALPAPDDSAVAAREYEAPHNDIETVLASIWQRLLGVERIGRHDHFFDMGGHSLKIMQLVSAVQEHFFVDISIADLFQTPILAHQADMIIAKQADAIDDQDENAMAELIDNMSTEELEAYLRMEEEA